MQGGCWLAGLCCGGVEPRASTAPNLFVWLPTCSFGSQPVYLAPNLFIWQLPPPPPTHTQVCTADGSACMDIVNAVPYIQKFHKHPVSGAPLELKDLIR